MSTKSTYQLTSEMALRKWRPGDNNTRQSCGPGLYVRGFKSGRKLFQLRYQKSWIDLGDYGPDLPLAQARETALKAKRLLKQGEVSPIIEWSMTTLRDRLIKICGKIVCHGRYVTFQMAEVAIARKLFADILRRIDRLSPKLCPA